MEWNDNGPDDNHVLTQYILHRRNFSLCLRPSSLVLFAVARQDKPRITADDDYPLRRGANAQFNSWS